MNWLVAVLCALAQDPKEELEALKKRMADLEKKVGSQAPPGDPAQGLPGKAAQEARRDAGEVYSKPFLARFGRNVYLGGYIDLEYFNVEDSNGDTFDQHRLVPFIYADVSEHIKVAMEIEIEHGNGTELGVEFAHVDYWIDPLINFRAGIILDPLGHFNLVHDAPFQDLTTRPLVDEVIIPSVLREPGIGFFGSTESGSWEFEYEVYVVNGFKGLSKANATVVNRTAGLRNARPHSTALGSAAYRDFNDDKAVVARVAVSPLLGAELGGSVHTGKYDESGDNTLSIWALDWTANLGGLLRPFGVTADFWTSFEVVGEFALADIKRDAAARLAGVPDDFHGWYLEPRFHFMPGFLRKLIPGASDESTFTLTYRYDDVDLDGFVKVQHTVGLNFRPREDTVFKVEFQWREEEDGLAEVDDDRFVASVATYF
jgi:hypothetical protein